MLKVVPLYDRVVIRRLKAASKTASGLVHIPDTAQDASLLGVVEEIGVGRNFDGPRMLQVERGGKDVPENGWTVELFRHPSLLKRGDLVTFGKWSGTAIQLTQDGDELFVMREDEVVAMFSGPQDEIDQAVTDYEEGRSVLKLTLQADASGPREA